MIRLRARAGCAGRLRREVLPRRGAHDLGEEAPHVGGELSAAGGRLVRAVRGAWLHGSTAAGPRPGASHIDNRQAKYEPRAPEGT